MTIQGQIISTSKVMSGNKGSVHRSWPGFGMCCCGERGAAVTLTWYVPKSTMFSVSMMTSETESVVKIVLTFARFPFVVVTTRLSAYYTTQSAGEKV